MRHLPFWLFLVAAPAAAAPAARPLSPDHGGHAMNPALSPDGSRLAYEVTHPTEKYTELFILDVATGREEKVRPAASASALGGKFQDVRQVNHEFVWSPRGDLWAFSSSGADEEFDVWIKGVSVPLGSEEKDGAPTFSADGRLIAFCSARTGEGDIYLHDVWSLEKAALRVTHRENALEFYAVFGPIGPRLAYTAMGEGGASIHVIDDVGGPKQTDRTLTRLQGSSIKPSWSPDGAWIAFFSNHGNEDRTRFDAWLVQAAGGEPFRAVRGVVPNERRGPAWSPDSGSLFVVSADPNQGDPILRVDLRTLQAEPVSTGTANNSDPDIRLDKGGQWLLTFVSQGERSSESQRYRRVWALTIPPRTKSP